MKRQTDRRKKKSRRYRYKPSGKQRWTWIALTALAALLVFSVAKLAGYGVALFSSRQTNDALRSQYYAASSQDTAPSDASEATRTEEESAEELLSDLPPVQAAAPVVAVPAVSPSAVPSIAPFSTYSPTLRLKAVNYPGNPHADISSRFSSLRLESPDAVGWLSITGMLDEVVVQRDNVFYLDHDAKEKTNNNGALFMDAAVKMKTRPYTLLIYGHNMRSGAEFGRLWRYENAGYYQANPFITFDSMYEEGRYVIFSSGKISMLPDTLHYVDFFAFTSSRARERQELIDTLIDCSSFTCEVDVQATDQLLVLVTCVDDDNERRVVAARRLRDDETEKQLRLAIQNSRST